MKHKLHSYDQDMSVSVRLGNTDEYSKQFQIGLIETTICKVRKMALDVQINV